jgi:hypothetical protein
MSHLNIPVETRLNLKNIQDLAEYDNEALIQLMFTIKRHAGTMSYYSEGEYYLIYFTDDGWKTANEELPTIKQHLEVQL